MVLKLRILNCAQLTELGVFVGQLEDLEAY